MAELKMNAEGGTLRVDVATRKFWSRELFNSVYY